MLFEVWKLWSLFQFKRCRNKIDSPSAEGDVTKVKIMLPSQWRSIPISCLQSEARWGDCSDLVPSLPSLCHFTGRWKTTSPLRQSHLPHKKENLLLFRRQHNTEKRWGKKWRITEFFISCFAKLFTPDYSLTWHCTSQCCELCKHPIMKNLRTHLKVGLKPQWKFIWKMYWRCTCRPSITNCAHSSFQTTFICDFTLTVGL